jgi:2-polyprenyl-3-methyl-5-hydroxy-6-metoxy-1,4-benzoquinol methylase
MDNNNSHDLHSDYWEQRKDAIYIYITKQICRKSCFNPISVIDIGSNSTPTLEWHRKNGVRLVSLDLENPYISEGVESIRADFIDYILDQRFDLLTCLQVLEHVEEPEKFAQKLLNSGKVLVVSVPYKWSKGACVYHIHDPVDEKKMFDWFGKPAVFSYIAKELSGVERLIQVYHGNK